MCVYVWGWVYSSVQRSEEIVRSLGAGAIGPCELQDADSGNWAPVLYKSRNALNHWVICHSSSKLESQTEVSSWLSLTMKTYTKCQSFQSSDSSSLWLANRALAGWLHGPLHSFAETQACKDGRYCVYMLLCGDAQACECMCSPKYNHGCLLQPLLWFLKHGCHSAWSSLILLGWLANESLRVHEFPPISDGNIDMCHRVLCSFLIWVLMTELGSSCLQSEQCTDWAISPAQYLSLAPPKWPDLQHACLWRSTGETKASMYRRWVSQNENSLSLSCLNTPVSASSSGVTSAYCLSGFGGSGLRSSWLAWQALHWLLTESPS